MIKKSKCSSDKDCHGKIPVEDQNGKTVWLYHYSDGPPDFGHYYFEYEHHSVFPEMTIFDKFKRFWIIHTQIRKMTFLGLPAHKARWKNR